MQDRIPTYTCTLLTTAKRNEPLGLTLSDTNEAVAVLATDQEREIGVHKDPHRCVL